MSTEDEQEEDIAHEKNYFAVKKALALVDAMEPSREMDEAMYAGSELGIFPFDEISADDALIIWRAVESVRLHGFPNNLKM